MPEQYDDELALSRYFERYVAAGKPGGRGFAVRNPIRTLSALRTLHRMPVTVYSPSEQPEAAEVLRALVDRPGWTVLRSAVSTLLVPTEAGDYTAGSSKATLRRKVRAAEKAGVTWRRIDDPEERFYLLSHADQYERTRAREEYRNSGADNGDLLDVSLWLGAFSAAGEPLMLSVTPVDGEWAALRYFRTCSDAPAASDARYLMSSVLVEHLAPLGVRRLVDTVHPIHLPNGLRHFQRMVGFRLERVHFAAPGTRRTPKSPLQQQRLDDDEIHAAPSKAVPNRRAKQSALVGDRA